jgi:integrase
VKAVKGHRYLYRRGDKLIFRRSVPAFAQAAFDNRAEVQVSLRTSDVAEARHLLPRENAKFEKAIADFQGHVSPATSAARRTGTVGTPKIEKVIRAYFADRMERVQEIDPSDAAAASDLIVLKADIERFRDDVTESRKPASGGWNQITLWTAEAIQDREGWALEGNDKRALMRLVAQAQVEAAERQLQMLNGEPSRVLDDTFGADRFRLDEARTDDPVTVSGASVSSASLAAMIEDYLQESDLAPATVKSYRRQFNVFQHFVGHDDANKVTKKLVAEWKDELLAGASPSGQALTARSVNDTYLAVVKAVGRWAVDNGRLLANPAEGVSVKKKRAIIDRIQGFYDDEASIILRGTLKVTPIGLSKERALARRWVPWICAYTGARVNEITQLRSKDLVNVNGVWAIHITPEAGSTKNGKSRTVALHPHVIEQGFVEIAHKASGPIFYDPDRRRGGTDANPQSKKVGEHLAKWVRSLGVTDKRVAPNHGWRHRFKTQARDLRLMPDIVDYILSHAPRSVGQSYGDVSVVATLREIEQLPRYDASK